MNTQEGLKNVGFSASCSVLSIKTVTLPNPMAFSIIILPNLGQIFFLLS